MSRKKRSRAKWGDVGTANRVASQEQERMVRVQTPTGYRVMPYSQWLKEPRTCEVCRSYDHTSLSHWLEPFAGPEHDMTPKLATSPIRRPDCAHVPSCGTLFTSSKQMGRRQNGLDR